MAEYKAGRNDSCPCGSGRKFKKCCLEKGSVPERRAPNEQRKSTSEEKLPFDQIMKLNLSYTDEYYEKEMRKLEEVVGCKLELFRAKDKVGIQVSSKFGRNGWGLAFNRQFELIRSQETSNDQLEIGFFILAAIYKHQKSPWKCFEKNWNLNHRLLHSYFGGSEVDKIIELKGLIVESEFFKQLPDSWECETLQGNLAPVENSRQRPLMIPHNHLAERVLRCCDSYFNERRDGVIKRFPSFDLSHLKFYFSDGAILPLESVFYSPYSVLLPEDLIPEFKMSHDEYRPEKFWPKEANEDQYRWEFQHSQNLLHLKKSLFKQFLKSEIFTKKKAGVFMSAKAPSTHGDRVELEGRWAFEVKEMDSMIYQYNLTENGICLTVPFPLDGFEFTQIAGSSFAFNGEKKAVILHNLEGQVEYLLKGKFFDENKLVQQGLKTHLVFNEYIDLNFFLQEFEGKFRPHFKAPPLEKNSSYKVRDEDLEMQLHLRDSGHCQYQIDFGLHFELFEEVYSLRKWPSFFASALRGMEGGLIDYYVGWDIRDLAVQGNSEKRKNDLKLIRHAGVFKVMLSEILTYLRDENRDENNAKKSKTKNLAHFQKELISKVLLILEKSSSSSGASSVNEAIGAKVEISSKIKKLISDFVEEWVALDGLWAQHLFMSKGQLAEVNLKRPMLSALEILLEWVGATYGAASFQKTSIKDLKLPKVSLFGESREQSYIEKMGDGKAGKRFDFILESMLYPELFIRMGDLYNIYVDGKKLDVLDEAMFKTQIELSHDDNGAINWFELHPQVFFGGKELSLENLQDIQAKKIMFFEGKPYYVDLKKMPRMNFLSAFWEKLNGEKKTAINALDAKIQEKKRSRVLEILSLRAQGIEVIHHESGEWKEICDNFDELISNKKCQFSDKKLKVPLKPYQKLGANWLYKLYQMGLGGILADDMGLGKTIQVIGLFEKIKLMGIASTPHLVVVPTSLIYNWISEIKRFAPHLSVSVFESKEKVHFVERINSTSPDVCLVTYGLLVENEEYFKEIEWQTVVFDEAQNLKNITSQRTSVARRIKAKSIFTLSGTPMENHYGEFFSLIDLCVPGCLGNYSEFMKTFNLKKVTEKLNSSSDDLEMSKRQEQTEINFLKLKTAPLVLRRLKKDILTELPEKTESNVMLAFEKKQKEIYRNVAISWNNEVRSLITKKENSNTQLKMLTALLRLRQICSYPAMAIKEEYRKVPPKFERLLETLEEVYAKGETVLVFTNFLETMFEFKKYLDNLRLRNFLIHGGVSAKQRQVVLREFEEENGPSVLMMTLKTGGVGLNLTKATYVIHLEPWWNPSAENQATDRAHRMGQKHHVQVYRYIMKDSVEEKIEELKGLKMQAFGALFGSEAELESESDLKQVKSFSGNLSHDDFQFLLS